MPHWSILLFSLYLIILYHIFDISKFKSQVIQETLPKCPQKGGGWLSERQRFMKSCLVLSLLYDFYFRIGRKKTMILSVLGLLASSLAVSWAADFYLFCVLRFVVGFSSAGLFMSTFVHGDYLNIQFHCIVFLLCFTSRSNFFIHMNTSQFAVY